MRRSSFSDRDFLGGKGFHSNVWGTANLFPMQDPIESGSHEVVVMPIESIGKTPRISALSRVDDANALRSVVS